MHLFLSSFDVSGGNGSSDADKKKPVETARKKQKTKVSKSERKLERTMEIDR